MKLLAVAMSLAALAQAEGNLYLDKVLPVFRKSCLGCHSAALKQGGLDMSTREALLKGSEHGPVVVPGKPQDSQLYKLVAHSVQPGMPFKAPKLPEESIAAIAEWIRQGAAFGEPVDAESSAAAAEAAKHWAFRKPVRPPVPAGSANPVDAFLQAERAKRSLKTAAPADRATLLRRVSLDLTGLPPTPEQVAAFVASRDPKAYEKAVDELLASPRHGERWGRHWLDVWRYSDWYGYRRSGEVRYSQKHIWRWRDWTVDAINSNKPYDRMILEMLAGDELAPSDPDTARATGYLARSYYKFNRNVWLQDTVEYTSTAFLGITLKCARCHTHKYDPIPHADYYKFRAFFEPHEVRTDRIEGQPDTAKNGLVRAYDADATRPTYRFIRGNESNPETSVPLEPAVPSLFGKPAVKIEPVQLPADVYFPDLRSFVPGDLLTEARAAVERAETALRKAREKPEPAAVIEAAAKNVEAAKAAVPALEARIRADQAAMATPVPENAEKLAQEARALERKANVLKADAEMVLARHEFDLAKGEEKKVGKATAKLEAAAKLLKEPAEGYSHVGPKYPTTSSGRRLALARFIASTDNPLTARVAINHMWLRHFGKPLVPTMFNFGRSGKPPSHPELLDWLASELMSSGWNMKAIHRLIVTSDAYRLRTADPAAEAANAKIDPDNKYLWRMNVRRMEAEAVRDSVLAIAGKLDTAMGGEEIDETKGHEVFRRSIYFRHTPDLQMDMLKVFDVASPNECFERSESIVPQQALALANGTLSTAMARVIAAGIPGTGTAFVDAAFRRILGRAPSAEESRESAAYLLGQVELYRDPARLTAFKTGPAATVKPSSDPEQRARESLVHVLLNHNDFVTIR